MIRRVQKLVPAGDKRRRLGLLAAPLTGALLLGILGGVGVGAVIHMPRVESLADFTPGVITRLYDLDGEVFATYAKERRILLDEDELPERVVQAVLASEDSNFFQHGGIDAEGVARAALRNLSEGRRGFGGSTLTMQLARRLFLHPKKTWRRKIEEALLAVELEKNFSKQQILTLYCNLMFLGHGTYGMEAGARYFFNKTAAELSIAEAATLAGILQRPSDYSPYRRPDLVLRRRDYVLRRMLEEGFISPEEHDAAAALPLEVARRHGQEQVAPYYAEEVRRYLQTQYGSDALLESGLQVFTTLDPRLQAAAESALRSGLSALDRRKGWRGAPRRLEDEDLERVELASWSSAPASPGAWLEGLVLESGARSARVKIGAEIHDLTAEGIAWTRKSRPRDLLRRGDVAWFRLEEIDGERRLRLEQEPEIEGAAVILDATTGAIHAMVGGWDFGRSEFNRATQAKRQVGSAFKPFVFGSALEMGFTPADTLFDAPTVFEGANRELNYSPRNYYREYYGIATLRRALELSWNVTSVKLLDLVGADRVIEFARRCGIRSELLPYPSLALGAAELTPLELAAAFSAIANQGIYVEPYLIERIESADGRLLEQHHATAYKSMEPEIAYLLTHMLEGVIDRGTAGSAADLPLDLAGKTGTTDNYTDAWFVGFNPRYSVLVWVGYDQKRRIGPRATGAEAALPIWRAVIEDGLERGWLASGERFLPPPGVTRVAVEYYTGLLPGPGATNLVDEAFVKGTEPVRHYEPKWRRIVDLPWYQQRPFYIPKAGENMPEDVADWEIVRQVWEEKAERAEQAAGG